MMSFEVFSIMRVVFFIAFVLVLGFIAVAIGRGIKEWSQNNAQPKIPAAALITAKRTALTHHHHYTGVSDNQHMHMTTSTSYFITCEFTSGDRMEFSVSAREYGLVSEGDTGILTSQGSRFISFERSC